VVQQKISAMFARAPFQGNAPAVVALLGGHIDAVIPESRTMPAPRRTQPDQSVCIPADHE